MRIDIDTISFVSVTDGPLTFVDLSMAEYAAVGISILNITGAPTLVRIEGIMRDDPTIINVFSQGDVLGTIDITGAPVAAPIKFMISRIGSLLTVKTQFLGEGFLLPPPLKYLGLRAGLVGGSSPAISGVVVIFKYIR